MPLCRGKKAWAKGRWGGLQQVCSIFVGITGGQASSREKVNNSKQKSKQMPSGDARASDDSQTLD